MGNREILRAIGSKDTCVALLDDDLSARSLFERSGLVRMGHFHGDFEDSVGLRIKIELR